MAKKRISHYIYRDAKTGRIVTEAYAKKNPNTTVKEAVYEK
tara:strand:- start:71 stop:193 length:123 start_codon:yes stop_codon:yes gene_type:complete